MWFEDWPLSDIKLIVSDIFGNFLKNKEFARNEGDIV